jgi:tRNA 2-thiocytidine biosynthesis protein TtcA
LGANKIALGHHRDDIVETLFLNMFFGAKLKAMPPKLATNDGAHIVIRPLAYCAEKDIARFAQHMQYPLIPCDLCGSQENLQRQHIKNMLSSWEKEYPGRIEKIFRAITNVEPSHLADIELFDFKGLSAMQTADEDLLFDDSFDQNHVLTALTLSEINGERIKFLRQTS